MIGKYNKYIRVFKWGNIMEITNFVTTEFLASFTGTLFVVELIVFVSKNLPIIKKIRTRFYTFLLALIHIIIMGFITKAATQTLVYYYSVFIDALIVTVMLCGGYDTIISRVTDINKKKVEDSSDTTNTTENDTINNEE